MKCFVSALISCHVVALAAGCAGQGENVTSATATSQAGTLKICIRLTATLADNATAWDFASLLPLTLTLNDYARTGKISNLPRRLTTDGAPSGSDPSAELLPDQSAS